MARWFRELFNEQADYNGTSLYSDIVVPWIGDAKIAVEESRELLDVDADIESDDHLQEVSWNLYALSRVFDYFVWHLQPQPPDGEIPDTSPQKAAGLTRAELSEFADAVGLAQAAQTAFHPFYHEPVCVEHIDSAAQTELVETLWPCLMLDNMLIYRGGTRLRSGDANLAKAQSAQGPLFWSRYRRARPSIDLSIGWGHNSQWRTEFRRDFELGDSFLYNADGRFSLNETVHKDDQYRADMPDDEWVHLIKYRYSIVAGHNRHDLWPWDYRYAENKQRG